MGRGKLQLPVMDCLLRHPGQRGENIANFLPTDANAVAFSRSTQQALNIVYLGGPAPGGFFPPG